MPERPVAASDVTRGPTPSALVVSESGFTHPGVFVGLARLRASRFEVEQGNQPWLQHFESLSSSPYIKREAPDPRVFASADSNDPQRSSCESSVSSACITFCGWYNTPDIGCSQLQADSRAVYGQALMYWYTGDASYARRAIDILNFYARAFKGNRGPNGPLVTAWAAEMMVRGAELIRYIYQPARGETPFDISAFEAMLRKEFVPTLTKYDYGRTNGNWKLSAADGLMNVAVFLDDRDLYWEAVAMWRERVPSYIYLTSDGELPVAPASKSGANRTAAELSCFWLADKPQPCRSDPKQNPGVQFHTGQTQESCRDLAHTSMGLTGILNAAETAWIQGDNLYAEQEERIVAGMSYIIQTAQNYQARGLPRGFCGGQRLGIGSESLSQLAVEVFYNALVVREGRNLTSLSVPGYEMPPDGTRLVADFIAERRSGEDRVGNLVAWESLTHHHAGSSSTARTPSDQSSPHPPEAQKAKGDKDVSVKEQQYLPLVAGIALALICAFVVFGVGLRRSGGRANRGQVGGERRSRRG